MSIADTYTAISKDFSKTRSRKWEEFVVFKKIIQSLTVTPSEGGPASRISLLDVGCGNGRFFEMLQDVSCEYQGVDASEGMIREARKKYPQTPFTIGDMRDLPFADNSFDGVIAIASLNHMLSHADQKKALKEMFRVLKPGGSLFMTNWNLWRISVVGKSWWKYNFLRTKSSVVTTRWNGHPLPYYAFTLRELLPLVKDVGFEVLESFYSKKGEKSRWWNGNNSVIIAERT
ncbi:MAG: class I SAM-dependent methyltransferase [Candidatus Jacksonbacteria bacterium]|jgi:ubiquinone/menaquinone biosynthesis C-methylase UbiE|nr:class I SAM-dependent methyltransferase [Candidatus Jacksonbacteria bacterium]MBT6034374.1 class I SAM-dependent methyltransferase [Candidatus Jacksonbacteria bacterium]MBT6300969.1 class I SAM-dependent methyltransferase [Candidatus Jacksonbacteria bacterium]MBT6757123.1 class I SAM-dependent methyltransferase [Candidatus Jacksonbacteria bacterium]MBT6955189.1 class I SAM-dependent methyltransferase [Candidatus Jacksonbacteria bacterium]